MEQNEKKGTKTRREAAAFIGISVPTLDRLVKEKRIPFIRVGRRVLFTESSLREHLDRSTQQPKN